MSIDKILLEILGNHFSGIVEEMGYVIHRAAFTVFVKETWDFDAALVTPDGEIFCYPREIGVTNMLGMHMGAAIRCIEHYEPGDVIVTNDPRSTKGMCTHLPDIMLFRPLFYEGRLLCFAWCFVHSSDVGGLVPGSIAPTAFDRFQEGLCIPPTKLFSRGELNQELLGLILANCRIPEQNWGDMKALIAALTICERRVGQVVARHGAAVVAEGIRALLDYGEARAREVLARVPDGAYEFADYVEIDYISPYYLRLKVKVIVSGSDVVLDFDGTDPQVRAALNLPTFGRTNQWIVLGIVNFLRTSDRGLPLNRGILRSVSVRIPEGSVLNPTPIAPSGVRHATGYRVADAVLGALAQAVPESIPTAGAGGASIVLFSHLDPKSGAYKVNVLQPVQGGCGGRPTKDGIDGVNFSTGSLRNVPTESIELEAPVFVHHYMLADNVAPGAHRGGAGVVFEFKCLTANAIVTARGMDRYKLRPYGRKGGAPGTLGNTVIDPGTPHERGIGKIDILQLAPGQVVSITSPGGAGYGDPLQRAPERVVKDVADGLVGIDEARSQYGVVVVDGNCDEAATAALRRDLARNSPPAEFVFGPERTAHEEMLPPALQDVASRLLVERPAAVRQYLRDQVYRAVEKDRGLAALTGHPLETALREVIDAALATGRVSMEAA
ncbi:MAG TPA: hydantoinase B/oxoprolinase family protein [Stellaceae bacterium]|nr:hydantoinase B/oxoprolinase family protein [Stellaceae bacterium]